MMKNQQTKLDQKREEAEARAAKPVGSDQLRRKLSAKERIETKRAEPSAICPANQSTAFWEPFARARTKSLMVSKKI